MARMGRRVRRGRDQTNEAESAVQLSTTWSCSLFLFPFFLPELPGLAVSKQANESQAISVDHFY